MEFRALSANATAAQAHNMGACHSTMLSGMQGSGALSDAAAQALQSCDLAAVLASCAMDDSHAESIESIVGAWPTTPDKNMTWSLNITQFVSPNQSIEVVHIQNKTVVGAIGAAGSPTGSQGAAKNAASSLCTMLPLHLTTHAGALVIVLLVLL